MNLNNSFNENPEDPEKRMNIIQNSTKTLRGQ